ncbi:leucine-rich repeat protein [Clostridium sp. MCC345]|nr:leucine-rich repeat protein [Clostridium sp. MCC345]
MVMKKNYYAKVLALTVAASMVSVPAFAEEGDGTAVAASVKNADTSLASEEEGKGTEVTIDKGEYADLVDITASVVDSQVRLDVAYHTEQENPMAGIYYTYELDGETVEGRAIAQSYIKNDGNKDLITAADQVTTDTWADATADCTIYLFNIPEGATNIVAKVEGMTYWSYDKDTKALEITGEGKMASFTTISGTGNPDSTDEKGSQWATFPWWKQQLEIETVTVGDGITTIGSQAFRKLIHMKTLTVNSADLETIYNTVCMNNESLETVDLSKCEKLTEVGDGAFSSLSLPSGNKCTLKLPKPAPDVWVNGVNYNYNSVIFSYTNAEGYQEMENNDFKAVSFDGETCEIVEYIGDGGEVVVPAKMTDTSRKEYTVTSVTASLFAYKSEITKVSFEEGTAITELPASFLAFKTTDNSSGVANETLVINLPATIKKFNDEAVRTYKTIGGITSGKNADIVDFTNAEEFAAQSMDCLGDTFKAKTLAFSGNLKSMAYSAFRASNIGTFLFKEGNYENTEIGVKVENRAPSSIGIVEFENGAANYNEMVDSLLTWNCVKKFVFDGADGAKETYTVNYTDKTVTWVTTGTDITTAPTVGDTWHGFTVSAVEAEKEVTIGSWLVNVDIINNKCELVKFNEPENFDGKIAIPSVMTYEGKGYPVTALREGVFAGSDTANKNALKEKITEIVFADDSQVKVIPNDFMAAGSGKEGEKFNLAKVVLPASVEKIGESAFASYSPKLTEFKIGSNGDANNIDMTNICSIGGISLGNLGLKSARQTVITFSAKLKTVGQNPFKNMTFKQFVFTAGDYADISINENSDRSLNLVDGALFKKGAKNVDAIISKLLKNVNKFVFETDDENTITYTVTYPKDGTEGSVKVEATGFVDKDFIEQTTWQGYSITDLNAKYIISFDANGGTGEMQDQEATITNSQVVSANLTKNTFKREDYKFAGWNTKADGSGDAYADQAGIPEVPVTLYAQWVKDIDQAGTYTVNAILDQTYTGQEIKPQVVVKKGDTVLNGGYTVEYADNTNVGEATVTVTVGGDSTEVKFKIVKDDKTKIEMAPVSVTYGTDYTLNPVAKTSAGNVIENANIALKYYTDEACQNEWTPSAKKTQPTAAGIYWAKASLTGTDNYADADEVVKVEILNATFTVSATGYSGTYDGKQHSISVDAGDAAVTYSTDGENYTAENPSFTDAGTYTVYYKAVKANHEDVLGSAEVKITKAAAKLELSAAGGSSRINRGPVTFTYTYDGDGKVTVASSDENVATASVDTDKKVVTVTLKAVGTAKITVSAAEGDNFLAKDATYGLTVQKKKSSSSSSATTTDKDKDNNKTIDNDKTTDNNQAKDDNSAAEKSKVIKLQIGSRIVNVDNEAVIYDTAPVIRNDRTLVPIRIVTETLGGKVDWNGVTKEVTLHIDGKEIKMTVGKTLEKYGVAPVIIDGRTFVPVRFVADELGATVAWDNATKTVTITKIEK